MKNYKIKNGFKEKNQTFAQIKKKLLFKLIRTMCHLKNIVLIYIIKKYFNL